MRPSRRWQLRDSGVAWMEDLFCAPRMHTLPAMSRLLSAAGTVVDRIKINRVEREYREGRTFWIKRRIAVAGPIMACANQFFRITGNPIQALTEAAEWQRWEVECFSRLHGGEYHVFAEGSNSVAAEEFPGQSLSRHLDQNTLTSPMLVAAARELRRAHEQDCPTYGARWSHGDPHAGNFIYDSAADVARLIDFEVRHEISLKADERHADDLLILLQDLVGRVSAEQWLPAAHAFIEAYGRAEIISLLPEKLVVPGGLPRIWWAVRTTYLASAELRRRIAALKEGL